MFATIIRNCRKIRAISREFSKEDAVDPSQFGDPLAEQVEWTPLGPNGTYAPMQRLRKKIANQMSARNTLMGYLLLLLFGYPMAFVGLLFLFGVFMVIDPLIFEPWGSGYMGKLIGAGFLLLMTFIFGVIGLFFISRMGSPIVFDKARGVFRKGFHFPFLGIITMWPLRGLKLSLNTIQAVQAIKGSVVGSYEFNLVLENGKRVNLLGCGSAKPIKQDAQTLSDFLGLPLWDAIPDWMVWNAPLPSECDDEAETPQFPATRRWLRQV